MSQILFYKATHIIYIVDFIAMKLYDVRVLNFECLKLKIGIIWLASYIMFQ